MRETNTPAPNFTLPDLSGNSVSLSDFHGEIILLNFWSAECPWASRVDPLLLSFIDEWQGRVRLISVAPNANEPLELLRSVAEERGLPLVLHDAERTVTEQYDAQTTPHLYVIDAEGVLRYQGGFDDVTFRNRTPSRTYVKEVVDALLAGDALPLTEMPPYGCTIVFYPE
jgi:peroxiredoxin